VGGAVQREGDGMFNIESDTQTGSAIFRKNLLTNAVLSKVVVREIHSDLYLNAAGLLTQEIENAKRFDSATVALLEASSLRLQAAEIVPID
jgi:hypothetical protein